MTPKEFGSDSGNQDAVIAQLAALARGDLSREDVVSNLRRDGHDALDVIFSVLDRAIKQSRAATDARAAALTVATLQGGPAARRAAWRPAEAGSPERHAL
jgi:hypothetical protein